MKTMKKAAIMIMAAAMLLLTACGKADTGATKEKYYKIYCGLNDAQTGTQVLSVEDAGQKIRGLITDRGLGYTEYTANGAYVEDGSIHPNEALIYQLIFVEKEEVESLAEEIREELDLESVLVEETEGTFHFLQTN